MSDQAEPLGPDDLALLAQVVEEDDAATREDHRDGVLAKASFTQLALRSAQARAKRARRGK